jgi:hypothetical protein
VKIILCLIATFSLIAGITSAQTSPPVDVQRYLLPLVPFRALPGAYGSVWHGELTVFNSGAQVVDVSARVCNSLLTSCFAHSFAVGPQGTASPLIYTGTVSEGTFLEVATPFANDLVMQYRIQDVSRQTQTWGTTLPVVPASQFRRLIELLELPTDNHFRVNVRIYSLGSSPSSVRVRVRSSTETTIFSDVLVQLSGFPSSGDPAYAFLNPVATGLPGARVRVEITQDDVSQAPVWAFASVTNNETQHVTIVTP